MARVEIKIIAPTGMLKTKAVDASVSVYREVFKSVEIISTINGRTEDGVPYEIVKLEVSK
jgi:hypothetical protein